MLPTFSFTMMSAPETNDCPDPSPPVDGAKGERLPEDACVRCKSVEEAAPVGFGLPLLAEWLPLLLLFMVVAADAAAARSGHSVATLTISSPRLRGTTTGTRPLPLPPPAPLPEGPARPLSVSGGVRDMRCGASSDPVLRVAVVSGAVVGESGWCGCEGSRAPPPPVPAVSCEAEGCRDTPSARRCGRELVAPS